MRCYVFIYVGILKMMLTCLCLPGFAQRFDGEYEQQIRAADSLYAIREFKKSAVHFSAAFESQSWLGLIDDRYRAAKSWAKIAQLDSAFNHLLRIARHGSFVDLYRLKKETAFIELRDDPRWKELTDLVSYNKKQKQIFAAVESDLVAMFDRDQAIREELDDVIKEYGTESNEFSQKVSEIEAADRVHMQKVTAILDQYGWLGEDQIGRHGNLALAILVVHAPTDTLVNLLPMIRGALQHGHIHPNNYMLIEDKISLVKNGYQLYGTQISVDEHGKSFVLPIHDKAQVNQRRLMLGGTTLEDYLKPHGIESY